MVNRDLQKAITFYQKKELFKAKEIFEKNYKEGNLDEQILAAFYLGKIAGILKEKIKEVKAYFDFVILHGNASFKGKAYMELGIYYRGQKNQKEMLNCYKKALIYIPNDIRLLTELGNYYLNKNAWDMQNIAQSYFRQILKLNESEEDEYKYTRNRNMAYFGLAKALTKQQLTKEAKEMLNEVEVQGQKDKEDMSKCYGNIAALEGKYQVAISFFQNNLKSHNDKVVNNAREKIGILYAITGEYDKAIIALEPVAKLSYKASVANFVLGKIYYLKKDYKKAYAASMRSKDVFDVALLYALKSAIYYDETLAILVGNTIVSNPKLLVKYRPYLLYLSKKYNIFFPGLDYNHLSSREKAIISLDILEVYEKTAHIYNLEYGKDVNAYTIFEENLEERILESMPIVKGGYYDSYYLKPTDTKIFKDKYILVTTLKDTKDIIEIKIVSPEQLATYNNKDIFESQKGLIRSLFK